jgi:putative phage-type endonuclease
MIVCRDFEQNTPEWIEARMGKPTASSFGKILTSTGKKSTQKADYLYKLAGERITGRKDDQFYSKAMERGHAVEPLARSFYSMSKGVKVDCPAIVYKDEKKLYSCSPDGLIMGKNEGLEIKCPELTAGVKYIHKGKLPSAYIPQVQGSLMITGYEVWNFLSYCPGLKPLILRIEPDEEYISLLTEAVEEFCYDLDELVEKVSEL